MFLVIKRSFPWRNFLSFYCCFNSVSTDKFSDCHFFLQNRSQKNPWIFVWEKGNHLLIISTPDMSFWNLISQATKHRWWHFPRDILYVTLSNLHEEHSTFLKQRTNCDSNNISSSCLEHSVYVEWQTLHHIRSNEVLRIKSPQKNMSTPKDLPETKYCQVTRYT